MSHSDLKSLHAFLKAVEAGRDWASLPTGDDPLVARVRAVLESERAASARIHHVERGLDQITSGLMKLAQGDFDVVLPATGHDAMVDAAFVGLTMLAEELEHSLAEMAHARDQAVEANRTKSVFLANMSHELRTPLNAIIGYCELLSDDLSELPGTAVFIEDLERVLRSARHLLGLLADLLDLSRIEAGGLSIDLAVFDASQVIVDVCTALRPRAHHRGNELVVEVGSGCEMHADPHRFKQILFNLIGNAVKFTSGGSIEVRAFRDPRGTHVVVADDGPGIPADRHAAVFLPFMQGSEDTSVTFGGTGLGLAITRRLCRLMEGDVVLDSAPGEGARFTVTLPGPPGALQG